MKLLRMDGTPVREEAHGTAGILIVLDGRMELAVQGDPVAVGPGGCTASRPGPPMPWGRAATAPC
ncbi:hypothetical protein J3S85_07070 [Streptomyces lavenduligriseus]|uniref:hypothetical protein n=1 Tax=Streptomyces eurythermus TaxID=42237 RepID=UPI0027A5AA17|nr:hypothetical protein J3S85_07070 [Streptomyces lavenduligriseus]